MRNAIFIEGVSGIGKSTAVGQLGDRLRSLGYSAICYAEGDSKHPLDLCWVAYLDLPEYESLLNSYPSFADAFAENIVCRSDSVLLRYQIGQTPLFPPEIHAELRRREFSYKPDRGAAPMRRFEEVFVNLWERFARSDAVQSVIASSTRRS